MANLFKILDLFCGGGGVSMGIFQALPKAEITGIDIKDQPDYPFNFIQGNVLDLKVKDLEEFDFIWASPPCQAYSTITHCAVIREQRRGNPDYDPDKLKDKYPELIGPVRKLLKKSGKPFVIENVISSPLRQDLLLCGTMFDLQVLRHRIFEISGFVCYQPYHPKHDGKYIYVCTKQQRKGEDLEACSEAMGIDWIGDHGVLGEAIPPAYSRYIFSEFLKKRTSLMDFINDRKISLLRKKNGDDLNKST